MFQINNSQQTLLITSLAPFLKFSLLSYMKTQAVQAEGLNKLV